MKALSIIGLIFGAFLIALGISSIRSVGGLSYAVIVGGVLVISFIGVIRLLMFIKEKKDK